jgi:hypothetical protein
MTVIITEVHYFVIIDCYLDRIKAGLKLRITFLKFNTITLTNNRDLYSRRYNNENKIQKKKYL